MLQAADPPPDKASDGAKDEAPDGAKDEAPGGADRPERACAVDETEAAWSEHEHLAVFDELVAEIAARAEPAYRHADGWLERTRAGLTELLRFCDEQPDTARELVIDSIGWGPEVLHRRCELLDALAAALDQGHVESELLGLATPGAGSAGQAAKPETAENLVGACISLVHTRLLCSGGAPVMELAPTLMSMIVHPYLGPRAARRELERSLVVGVERHAAKASANDSARPVAAVRERSY